MSQEGVNCTLQQNVSYSVSPHITSHRADARQRNIDQSMVYDRNGYVAVKEPVRHSQRNKLTNSEHLQCQQNPSYSVSPHLTTTNNHDPDCGHNQSYNVIPESVHLRFNARNPVVGNGASKFLSETYDDTEPTQGSQTSTGIIHSGVYGSNQGNDEEVYETMDDYLVQPPPPSYEDVLTQQSPMTVTTGHGSRLGDQRIPSSRYHIPMAGDQQPPVTVVSTQKARTGGEYYRLSVVLMILTIVFCQLHVLLCAIPAIVFSVKARKYKTTGDLERAKRFDKYSFRFAVPGLVLIILAIILFVLSPVLGGLALIIWLVTLCTSCIG